MIEIIGFETRTIYDCENCGYRFSDREDIIKKISFILKAN